MREIDRVTSLVVELLFTSFSVDITAIFSPVRDLQNDFGVDYSVFSKVFLNVLDYMDASYSHLYSNLGAAQIN
jgi:hypothetical protein